MTYRHPIYLYKGSIYDMNGSIIKHPALLFDKKDDCLQGFGEAENLIPKLHRMADAFHRLGFPDMAASLMLIDFSNASFRRLTNEEICYILRRAIEFTATGFLTELAKHTINPDFKTWVQSEMKRIPIDLSEQETTY